MPVRSLGAPFNRLWLAAAISNTGDGLLLAAMPLLAERLGAQPVFVAGLEVAHTLPWLAIGLLGGAIADRGDRRSIMVRVDLARALAVLVLAVMVAADQASIVALWAVMLAIATGEVFFDNASQAMLPTVVGEDDLEAANSRLWVTQSVTNELVGPALGAVAFAAIASLPFFAESASFAIAAVVVFGLRGNYRAERAELHDAQTRPSIRADLAEAWAYLREHTLLRNLMTLGAAWNFFATGAQATDVLLARRVLGVEPAVYGVMLAGMAVGGILGGVVAERVARRLGPGSTVIGALVVSGAAGLGAGLAPNAWVFTVAVAGIFFSSTIANVVVVSLRQRLVPDALRGRVNAFARTALVSAAPAGAIVGGLSAQYISLRAPNLVLGVAALALAAAALPSVNNRTIAAARSGQVTES